MSEISQETTAPQPVVQSLSQQEIDQLLTESEATTTKQQILQAFRKLEIGAGLVVQVPKDRNQGVFASDVSVYLSNNGHPRNAKIVKKPIADTSVILIKRLR